MSSKDQLDKLKIDNSDNDESDSETIGFFENQEYSKQEVFKESFPKKLIYSFHWIPFSYHLTETLFKLQDGFDTWKWFNISSYSGPDEVVVPVINQHKTFLYGGPKHTKNIYNKLIEKAPFVKNNLVHIVISQYKTYQHYVICVSELSSRNISIYSFPKFHFDKFINFAEGNFTTKTSIPRGVYIKCAYYELWRNLLLQTSQKVGPNVAFVILEDNRKVSFPRKKFNFGRSMEGHEQWVVYQAKWISDLNK